MKRCAARHHMTRSDGQSVDDGGAALTSQPPADSLELRHAATDRATIIVVPERTLLGHAKGITSIAFSPDGSYLASTSADETFKFWKVQP